MSSRNCIAACMMTAVIMMPTLLPAAASAQNDAEEPSPLFDFQTESEFIPSTPSVAGGAVGAWGNPAAWATSDQAEMAFWWNDRSIAPGSLDNWGVSFGRSLGFAFNRRTVGYGDETHHLDDYQFGLAFGDRRWHWGIAHRWSSSETDAIPRENSLLCGLISRPNEWYSIGAAGMFSTESRARQAILDLGIRPLGRDWFTIFADYTLQRTDKLTDGLAGIGIEIRPVPGLHLGIKFREVDDPMQDFRYTFNLGVTLSGFGFHALPGYDEDGDYTHSTFLVRHKPSYRSVPADINILDTAPRYVPISLENKRLTYQRYRWLEKKRVAWFDLMQYLNAVRDCDDADGICLNLAGFSARPSLGWELRNKLAELQAHGKEVIIHADRLTMIGYYIASIADRITIDPQGDLMLPGLSAKRTYVKSALEKMGIGFQEFRHFTHKSAMEAFSRDSMSDADREQIGRIVDVIYDTARDGICEGRGISKTQFETVVEEEALLTAGAALRRGLVDDIARWSDVGAWLSENRDGARFWQLPEDENQRKFHEEVWGKPPKIAVVYAVGECNMDSGIKGRATSAFMRALAKDRDVKAVVFRADSPGGDPLPSDLVADAIDKIKEAEKPVIVTQGDVAGSGGYWISMNGSRILTTPMTLTGSIGVIAGWFWDDGIGEKMGMTADGVQRGSHSDLFRGIRFPLLGVEIPQRPLDNKELRMVKSLMMELYDDFVDHVAKSRNLEIARVRKLAEGRIWMGGDAIGHGLVDDYGSLQDAIDLAMEMAGIEPGTEVEFVEFPPRPLIEFPDFGGGAPSLRSLAGVVRPVTGLLQRFVRLMPLGAAATAATAAPADVTEETGVDYATQYLRVLGRVPGAPALIVPPTLVLEEWWSER